MKTMAVYSLGIEKMEKYIAGISLGVSTALVFIGVVSRYIFSYGYSGWEELERYLIIWSVFVASSYAIKKNGHITVSVITDLLPEEVERKVKTFAILVGLGFCIFLFLQGVRISIDSFLGGEVSSSAMRLPMVLVRMAVPFGAILMIFRFIECLTILWRKPKET